MYRYIECQSVIQVMPYRILKHIIRKLNPRYPYKNRLDILSQLEKEYFVDRSLRKKDKYMKFQKIVNKEIHYMLSTYTKDWKKFKNNRYSFPIKLHYFTKEKSKLINLFNQDIIDKSFLIKYTYILIKYLEIEPLEKPQKIDGMVFNYQYYNALIKYYSMNNSNQGLLEELYAMKDKHILLIIEEVNDIFSYYISVDSKTLYFKLFEVYIKPYDLIMHSVNPSVKKKLQEKGCFQLDVLTSRVNEYVNSTY